MNTRLPLAFVFLCSAAGAFAAPSQEEITSLMNKVEARVAAGDISALNDLMTLPGDWAVPAFLNIFKENYNIYGATAENRAIGLKAAQLATAVPGGPAYLANMLKKQPEDSPNWVFIQQDFSFKLLIAAHNKTAVRMLCDVLDNPDTGGRAANALANMSLPDAPYSSRDKAGNTNA